MPLQGEVWGQAVEVTPNRGRGYGRGAGVAGEVGLSEAAHALIVGFDDWDTRNFAPRYPDPWVKAGGGPGVHPVAWYRAALDGSDAAAPRLLFESSEAITPFTLTTDGRDGFVATLDGIWRVPLDGSAEPSLLVSAHAGTRVSALAVLEGVGRLAFIEVGLERRWARLQSVPLTDDGTAPETLLDLGELSAFDFVDDLRAARLLRRVDDRRVWVRVGGHDDLVDLAGGRPPFALRNDSKTVYEVRVVGDHAVWLRAGDPGFEVVSAPLDSPNADAATVLGPSLGAARASLILGRDQVAWLSGDGLRVARTDGRHQRLITLGPLLDDPRFAFGPDGETLVVCHGSSAAVVPPGAEAATPLQLQPGSVCDLGHLGTRGQIGVFHWAQGSEPGLDLYSLDGQPMAHVELPGQDDCGLTTGGALCRRRHRDLTLRRADAGRDAELQLEASDAVSMTTPVLTPGGRFVVVRVEVSGRWTLRAIPVGSPPFVPATLEGESVGYRADAQIAKRNDAEAGATILLRVPLNRGVAAATVLDRVSDILADLPRAGGVLARAWAGPGVPGDLVFVADDGGGTSTLVPAVDIREFAAPPIEVAVPGGGIALAVATHAADGLDVSLLPAPGQARGRAGTARLPALANPQLLDLPTPGHVLVVGGGGPGDGTYRVEFSGEADGPRVVELSRPMPGALHMGSLVPDGFRPSNTSADHGVILVSAWVEVAGGDAESRRYALRAEAAPDVAWTPLLPGVAQCLGEGLTSDGRSALIRAKDGTAWLVPTDGGDEAHALFREWVDKSDPCLTVRRLDTHVDPPGRLVYVEPGTSRLIAFDRESGESDVRFEPGGHRGNLALETVTPDGEAAVIRWHGPTGHRLYVVSLNGPMGVAPLGPGDLDRDERWLGFAGEGGP